MNLQQLKYFIKLAEVRHFGHAAQQLHITQPALSNSIKGLEQELGASLFDRKERQVSLTPYGSRFLPHIIKALGEIDCAVQLAPNPQVKAQPIRIATVASIQQTFLPSLLVDYAEDLRSSGKSPFSELDIQEGGTSFNCMNLMQKDLLDIAFCGRTPSLGFAWTPVLPQNLVAAVNPSHPLAEKETVNLKELADYPLISYRSTSALFQPVKALADTLKLHAQQAFNDELGAVPYLAVNPQCVALLLDSIVEDVKSHIRCIPIEELDRPFHMVGLTYKTSSLLNEDVQDFVSYMERRFSSASGITPIEDMLLS